MEIVECGVEHLTWKAGWPQPGEEEKGKEGEEMKGGQGEGDFVVSGLEEQALTGVEEEEKFGQTVVRSTTMAAAKSDIDVGKMAKGWASHVKRWRSEKPIWAKNLILEL